MSVKTQNTKEQMQPFIHALQHLDQHRLSVDAQGNLKFKTKTWFTNKIGLNNEENVQTMQQINSAVLKQFSKQNIMFCLVPDSPKPFTLINPPTSSNNHATDVEDVEIDVRAPTNANNIQEVNAEKEDALKEIDKCAQEVQQALEKYQETIGVEGDIDKEIIDLEQHQSRLRQQQKEEREKQNAALSVPSAKELWPRSSRSSLLTLTPACTDANIKSVAIRLDILKTKKTAITQVQTRVKEIQEIKKLAFRAWCTEIMEFKRSD